MNFAFSEEQEELRNIVRQFLEAKSRVTATSNSSLFSKRWAAHFCVRRTSLLLFLPPTP